MWKRQVQKLMVFSIPVFLYIFLKKDNSSTTKTTITPLHTFIKKTSTPKEIKQTSGQLKQYHSHKLSNKSKKKSNTTLIPQSFYKECQSYFEKRTHIIESKKLNHVLHHLIQNKQNIRYATKILGDPKYTKAEYGKEQGKLRLFAINLLAVAAQFGHRQILESLISQLLSSLTKETTRGQSADITDLITAWIIAYGKNRLIQDPLLLFEHFNYTRIMRPLFATALRYAFSPHELDKIAPRLLGYLNG